MKGTVKELAEHYGINSVNMYGLIKSLIPLGHVKEVGKGPKPKRGRQSSLYQFSEKMQIILSEGKKSKAI